MPAEPTPRDSVAGVATRMNESEAQEPVFALLAEPATHGGAAVKRIDTHAASVFLAGPRTFKVKRAVRFPFLDYSTLDLRKQACEAELEVNRPFAPEIYRRVVPITREPDGRLALDGAGTPVEWAVEMRRFDEGATLDHLAEAGRVDAALADVLGRTVAAAHAPAPAVDAGPWVKALADYIDEHATAFGETPDLFPPEGVDALARASRAAYARIHPLLLERARGGLVRRIHGDLHLGNIVLLEGRPVLFDAIEFSPLIASGDVLYDLAFLLMDLTERGLRPAANIVLNRYLVTTGRAEDFDGLATLPFYLSMRAAIRAKVTAARLQSSTTEKKDAIAGIARKYFDVARQLIEPPAPRLIAVGGLSGTGKSALARALAPNIAPQPGAVVLRSDVIRKQLLRVAHTDRLPPSTYRPEVTARVYEVAARRAGQVRAQGHSAIVGAVFARESERDELAALGRECNVPLRGLFLVADLATRQARIGRRRGDASDATQEVAAQQEHYNIGHIGWASINASG